MGDDDEEGASVEVEVGSEDLSSANVIDDLPKWEKCGFVEGQKQVGNINRSRSNLKEMPYTRRGYDPVSWHAWIIMLLTCESQCSIRFHNPKNAYGSSHRMPLV